MVLVPEKQHLLVNMTMTYKFCWPGAHQGSIWPLVCFTEIAEGRKEIKEKTLSEAIQ